MKSTVKSDGEFLRLAAKILKKRFPDGNIINFQISADWLYRAFGVKCPKNYPCFVSIWGVDIDEGPHGEPCFELRVTVKTLSELKKQQTEINNWIRELEAT